jgi:DNA-directed RNA polymerase subunit M/transcription elongation factor TFIIS
VSKNERYFCRDCPDAETFTRIVTYTKTVYETVDPTGTHILNEESMGADPDSYNELEVTCDECGEEAEWGDPRSALEQIASVMEDEDE